MGTITNPILPGFHPDPSICRVGDDYYIANSTFEWFPGVAIYHSRDLVHWRLAARPLDRVSRLDLKGVMNGGGIWAPCLSYADGRFWLIYTNMKTSRGGLKDSPNYLVTAPEITGPWSEPIFLNASGFDPSLYHDDDGRKWLVNMLSDHRKERNRFAGIVLQEYSARERKLVGPITNIFRGTELGCTEGPHIYRRNGWYYLMTAEGGTSYEHAVTMGRSKSITGPYEVDPENPILTSRSNPELALQKAGHASLVEVGDGQWYLVHLCGRPITEHRRCILGRETAIQKVYWTDDGWVRLEGGGNEPRVEVPAPGLGEHEFAPEPKRHNFDGKELSPCFLSLRIPVDDDWASLAARPGYLRLTGRQTLLSVHEQSLIARRLDAFHSRWATCVDFEPENFQQMAGLVAYYNTKNWIYLHVTMDEKIGKCLKIGVMDREEYDEPFSEDVALPAGPICLSGEIENEHLRFYYRPGPEVQRGDYLPVGPVLDASKLSDDYVPRAAFTGAMVGICCQDLGGTRKTADFSWFEYEKKN